MRPYSVLSVGRFEQETYILLVLTLFNLCGLKKNCNDLKLWRLLYSLLSWICLEWWLLLLRLSLNLCALRFMLFLVLFCLCALLPFLLFFFLLWVHFCIAQPLLPPPPPPPDERFSSLHRFWTFDLCFTFLCGRISIRTKKKKH